MAKYRKSIYISYMSPEEQLMLFLRKYRNIYSCDQVSNYGCKADILAIDKKNKQVLEYEFKRSSHDLKVLEWDKRKYGRNYKVPHRFYFVMPCELYEKEIRYLETLKDVGIITWKLSLNGKNLEFTSQKNSKLNKTNVQDYDKALMNLLSRATSKITFAPLNKKS